MSEDLNHTIIDGIAPPGSRIRLAHHTFEMPDGHRVGLSVGGQGVPLVFFHGIGLNRRVYLRLLSRLPHLGFMVWASTPQATGSRSGLHADTATSTPG